MFVKDTAISKFVDIMFDIWKVNVLNYKKYILLLFKVGWS